MTSAPANERICACLTAAAGLLTLVKPYLAPPSVLILWLLLHRRYRLVDRVGRAAMNFWFTAVLLLLVVWALQKFAGALPAISFDGYVSPQTQVAMAILLLLYAYALSGIFFSGIAAERAFRGVIFRYPGAIPFFRIPKGES